MRQLHSEQVVTAGSAPARWLWLLPGIFGAGRNWGTVARRVVRERPDWGALLVDLRQHGASQGFPPPHTVAAAAGDLVGLAAAAPPPDALLGHSFGGKVALVAAGLPLLRERLRQLWIIDSTADAGEPGGSAWQMLRLLRGLPRAYASRDQLTAALAAADIPRQTALWMATNLQPEGGEYRWRFDLAAMEALLGSFFATDAWAVIEHTPPGLTIHLVRATGSSVMGEAAVARARAATVGGQVQLHDVAGGHWLNADNPDRIVEMLVGNLPG